MKIVLAIDPGAAGGLAWRDSQGIVGCQAMPETPGDVIELLRTLGNAGEGIAFMEKVGGFAGGLGQPGSAMFKFGYGAGFIVGALMMDRWRVEEVAPQKWQKFFGLGTKSMMVREATAPYKGLKDKDSIKASKAAANHAKTAWKNKLKSEAQRRYPNLKITLDTADAVLILDYALHNLPSEEPTIDPNFLP